MKNNLLYKCFDTTVVSPETVLVNVNLSNFTDQTEVEFSNILHLIKYQGFKMIVVDFSLTEFLSKSLMEILLAFVYELENIGGSLRLVVSIEKPRLSFSLGNPISKLDVYLTKEQAFGF